VDEPPEVNGASLPLRGKLFEMLTQVYDRSETECDIPISFKPDSPDRQHNAVHTSIVDFVRNPDPGAGRILAERLRDHSTAKSGLGLLFFITGREGRTHKLVISRFPADEGILAEVSGRSLDVKFIERVFMKRATA
jgi:hypothetical protein